MLVRDMFYDQGSHNHIPVVVFSGMVAAHTNESATSKLVYFAPCLSEDLYFPFVGWGS